LRVGDGAIVIPAFVPAWPHRSMLDTHPQNLSYHCETPEI